MMHRELEHQHIVMPHITHATRCPAPIALSRRMMIVIAACFLVAIVIVGLTMQDDQASQSTAHTQLKSSVAAPENMEPIESTTNLTQPESQLPLSLLVESSEIDAFGNEARNDTEEEEPEHHRCAKLPRTQSLLHSWLEYEAHASMSLLHSIAASLALLIIPSNATTRSRNPSVCGLALNPQETMLRDRDGRYRSFVQEGLFFDPEAESFWTMQRPSHSHRHHKDGADEHHKAVWIEGISNGDCLVCTPESDCVGLALAQQQIRKTMAHAPEGWSSVHVHECQEQEQVYLPHPQQRWKNECVPICLAAYGPHALRLDSELHPIDPSSMTWLACQICQQMDGQVDVAAEVDIKQAEASAQELEKGRAQADRMMSKLFHPAAAPPDDELWPTSRLAPSLGSWSASSLQDSPHSGHRDLPPGHAVRAFFLDWTGDLTGVSQLLAAAISKPETLRQLFADTHNHSRTVEKDPPTSKEQFAFADQLPFRASPSSGADSEAELYDIDPAFVQTALKRIINAQGDNSSQRQHHGQNDRIVKLGGGGGGGMGLQLECLAEGETADEGEATPLLSVGGGGGGGYRSLHQPGASIESSFFKGGAGGGAGLQSWGLMDPELPTAGGGLTVGGGGGGGIRLQLARRYKRSMKIREGRVLSHKHGASPDALIALPAEHGTSEFSRFPALLARRMRSCMASPRSKLLLRGAGGAGGGVKLSILDALRADPSNSQSSAGARTRSTTKLRHSVNLKLSYEFNTCDWDRSTAPCAEIRAFPDKLSAQRMRIEMLTRRKMEAVRSEATRSLALLEHPIRNNSRGSSGAWSGEMQRQLAECLAKSRDLSRQLADEQESSSPINSTAASPSSRVPRKVAFDDLLCTCFFSAFGSRSANSSTADSDDSWLMPSFCRRKARRKRELARIRGEEPDVHAEPANGNSAAQPAAGADHEATIT